MLGVFRFAGDAHRLTALESNTEVMLRRHAATSSAHSSADLRTAPRFAMRATSTATPPHVCKAVSRTGTVHPFGQSRHRRDSAATVT